MKSDMKTFDYMKTILNSLYLLSFLLLMGCNRECYEPGMEKYLPVAETGDAEIYSSSVTFNGSISGLKVGLSTGLYESDIHGGQNKISATYFLLSTDKKFQTDVEQIKANFSSADVDSETDYYKLIHCDYHAYGRELQPNTTYYYKFCAEQGQYDGVYAEIHGEVKSFTFNLLVAFSEMWCEAEGDRICFGGRIENLGDRGEYLDDMAVVISSGGDIDGDGTMWFWASEFEYSFEHGAYNYSFHFDTVYDSIVSEFPEQFCFNFVYLDAETGNRFVSKPCEFMWPEEVK